MITLTFLVCSMQACFAVSPQQVFRDPVSCEIFAEQVMIENQRKVDTGEMAPHMARYTCYEWGRPA